MINNKEEHSQTITKAIDNFIFHCQYERNLNEKTLKAYKTDLNQFVTFLGYSELYIESIDKYVIKQYMRSISQFKPKTMKRKIASLKAMFNFIEFESESYVNPFRKIKIKIKEPLNLPTVMNINEIKKIIQLMYRELENLEMSQLYRRKALIRNIAIVELLFATGIRVSELCNLKCDDIDTKTGFIKVFGKGSKERIIQICQKEVLTALKDYQKLFAPSTFFFVNRLGNKTSPQSVRLLVKHYAKLSGTNKNITPHTFRHTFATLLLEEDVDIKYIQNLLGHSSIATTQIYTHVNSHKQKRILSTKHPRRKLTFRG